MTNCLNPPEYTSERRINNGRLDPIVDKRRFSGIVSLAPPAAYRKFTSMSDTIRLKACV